MAAYNRISLNDLINRCSERVGNNTTFWAAAEKRNAINEAIRVWAVMTGQWSKRFQVNTVAGQRFYDVPKQIVSLQRVRYNSGTILYQSSVTEMDYGFNNWMQSATGTPQVWAPVGLDLFVINPPAAAGNVLYVEGIALAPAMGAGGDFADIGDEEISRILDYAHTYCLDPKTKILFADLRWRPISEARVGDALLGFEETGSQYERRKWCRSVVEDVHTIDRPCVEIILEDGTELLCSEEHPWLARLYQSSNNTGWVSAAKLVPGRHRLCRLLDTWHDDYSYNAGYIAAALDGEGCLVQAERHLRLGFSQTENPMLPKMHEALLAGGYEYSVVWNMHESRQNYKPISYTTIRHKKDVLRLLGSCRPARLLPKVDLDNIGILHSTGVSIRSVRPVGTHQVVAIKTSSRTFVAEGLASHNCAFKEGGLEFQATQPLIGSFVEACVQRNQRLLGTSVFRKYLGMAKQDEQRPVRSQEQAPAARA